MLWNDECRKYVNLKNDPVGIVTLANFVEGSWSQNAVEDEEGVVK